MHPQTKFGYAYEKLDPTLRWYGAPRMVNPALETFNVDMLIGVLLVLCSLDGRQFAVKCLINL